MSVFTVPLTSTPPASSSDPILFDPDLEGLDYGLDESLEADDNDMEGRDDNEEEERSSAAASQQQTHPPPAVDPSRISDIVDEVNETKKKGGEANPLLDPQHNSHYILGTLIVRVVAGRGIPAAVAGGFGQVFTGGSNEAQKKNAQPRSQRVLRMLSAGSSNPYVKVSFDGTVQQMQQVFDTLDPQWPRESAFFDVKIATAILALEEENGKDYVPPSPVLVVDLLHSDSPPAGKGKKAKQAAGAAAGAAASSSGAGDNFVTPLGSVRINILDIITGKKASIDDWFDLPEQGALRVMVEYEVADERPAVGDMVRINGFCSPQNVFPIPVHRLFEVDDVDGDYVILKYTTEEDWECVFQLHRFCVISAVRHQRALQQYQDKILEVAERFSHSPMVDTLVDVYQNDLKTDGVVGVLASGLAAGMPLLNKWLDSGVDTVLEDVKFATNWDGKIKPDGDEDEEEDGSEDGDNEKKKSDNDAYEREGEDRVPLDGMPCCPITGVPMLEPVVAADGHTYERKAIIRWLETSDKSPLTGAELVHKEVVVNFSLIERVQDMAIKEAARLVELETSFNLENDDSGAGGGEGDKDDKKAGGVHDDNGDDDGGGDEDEDLKEEDELKKENSADEVVEWREVE
mmetsp:Transcript_23013/g.47821  ORF Transcript_23013/g.47821 Transcript_23013/m.47821 type:complete len:630 (+) Transcript_23013:169-2058(+)